MTTTSIQSARQLEQSLRALAHGDQIRLARAEAKRQLRHRQTTLAELFEHPSEALKGIEIEKLLLALPRWGPARVTKLLARLGISPNRPLWKLTERQLEQIKTGTQPVRRRR